MCLHAAAIKVEGKMSLSLWVLLVVLLVIAVVIIVPIGVLWFVMSRLLGN
jgi:hypothetical protein